MIAASNKHLLLLPLLALAVSFSFARPAREQDAQSSRESGAAASLHVSFGAPLHWASVQGTRVEELPAVERPEYDLFRYGGTYYAYNNNRWYSSPNESGDFAAIDDRAVPSEFSSVPREHWHNYPSSWQDRHDPSAVGAAATLQVNLGPSAQWTGVGNSGIDELPVAQRPNFDVFRSGGTYYAYDDNRWYMSRLESGQYTAMDDRDVPTTFSGVPREHWHHYPSGWQEHKAGAMEPRNATMQVRFASLPHWTNIRGTRVQQVRNGERPDYDMFRFAGGYYVYTNDRWFTSQHARGEYTAIDERAVPSAVYRVPRQHWRNYPAHWNDKNSDPRTSENAGSHS